MTDTMTARPAIGGQSTVELTVGVIVVGGIAGFLISPHSGGLIVGEDGVVEWLSATLYGLASALALLALRATARRWADRAVLLFIAALGLVCLLSEISFGARLGGFAMPAMPGGGEFDGGQDVAMLAARYFRWIGAGLWLPKLVFLLSLAAASIYLALRYGLVGRVWRWQAEDLRRGFMLAAVAVLAFAVVLDVLEWRKLAPVEELAELFAAALLLTAALLGRRVRRAGVSPQSAIVSRLAKPCGVSPSSKGVVTSTKVSG